MKNVATTSPFSFLPTDFALIILASPAVIASSIVSRNWSPSLHVKKVRPVAFLKYSDSTLTTNIDTGGFRLCKYAMANAPVLSSAAMLRQAK